MTSKHRITVGEELRYDGDVQGLRGLSATYEQKGLWLDLRDFVHAGDGSNYRPALARALSSASTAGGAIIRCPPGTYTVVLSSSTLSIPANTTIVGVAGKTVFNLDTDSAGTYREVFRNVGDNTAIEGLTFTRVSDFPLVMFPVQSYSGMRFTRCRLVGNRDTFTTNFCHGWQLGVQAGTSDTLLIEQCMVTTMSYGLLQTNLSTTTINRVTVRDSIFTTNYSSDLELNAPIATCNDVRVLDCTFLNNQVTAAGAGFGVGLAHITRATVRGCYFNGYQNEPIHVEDYSDQVLIQGNRFASCALTRASYVQVISGGSSVRIVSNDIDATTNSNFPVLVNVLAGGTGSTPGGRTVIPPRRVTIKDNELRCGGGSGIYVEATDRSTIEGNRISGNGAYSGSAYNNGNGGYGVQLYDGTNTVCNGNAMTGFNSGFYHRNNGILSGGQGFTISGNYLSDCKYGISMVNTGAGAIVGNHIRNCEHPLITGTGGSAAFPVVVTGNHAYGCTYRMEVAGTLIVIANGAATIGSAVSLTIQAAALDMPSGTVLTFTGGGVLTLTARCSVGATTMTGNLAAANVASGQIATVTGLAHSSVGAQNKIAVYGNGDFVAGTY